MASKYARLLSYIWCIRRVSSYCIASESYVLQLKDEYCAVAGWRTEHCNDSGTYLAILGIITSCLQNPHQPLLVCTAYETRLLMLSWHYIRDESALQPANPC